MVHEAYLRLVGEQEFANRGHFFAAAAEAMRRILLENARLVQLYEATAKKAEAAKWRVAGLAYKAHHFAHFVTVKTKAASPAIVCHCPGDKLSKGLDLGQKVKMLGRFSRNDLTPLRTCIVIDLLPLLGEQTRQ